MADTMGKINWKTIWEWTLKTAILFILDVIVIKIGNLQGYCTSFNVPCWAVTIIGIVFLSLFLLAVVHLFWICITKASKIIGYWQKKPKIKLWFKLPNENDLRLYVYNPKRARETRIDVSFKTAINRKGENYLNEHRQELKLLENQFGVSNSLINETVIANDKREKKVGISRNGKIAVYFGNALLGNFPDGTFEYTISCTGEYMKNRFYLQDKSVWLTIKNGVLISID
jgi:hypothetical protein